MICRSLGISISFSIANIHDSKCNNLLEEVVIDSPYSTVFSDKIYYNDSLISYADFFYIFIEHM
ncbi:MAG: hypothetical protein MJH09_04655 [Cetobacterium sp.]|nr:hypothetical protein [Cetobacterium sp.]